MSDASLPDWWSYPTHCGNGHAWGPGKVIVSWLPCMCGSARAAHARGSGHRTVTCRVAGCGYVCFEPAHEPQPGVAPGGHSGDGLSRRPGTPRPRRGRPGATWPGRSRARWPGRLWCRPWPGPRTGSSRPGLVRPGLPSRARQPGLVHPGSASRALRPGPAAR